MTEKKGPKRTIRYDRIALLAVIALAVILLLVILIKNITSGKDSKPAPTAEPTAETTPETAGEPEETATPEPTADPETDARFFDKDSLLIIANKKHRLPEGYKPEDLAYPEVEMRYNTWTLRMEAAVALEEMFAAAEKDGVYLVMGSGYRGEDFQSELYYGYVNDYGQETADALSSRPGYSDHQTGLATDLCGQDTNYDLNEAFETTGEGKWLAANAHKYGFIMRYPKGKESVTGYAYEPWHFRYVGKEWAKKIYEAGENMTMEEYFGISGGDYAD